MKTSLLFLLLVISFAATAQKIDTPYHCNDGRIIRVGDTLNLGSGTLPSGDFKYIYLLGNTEQVPLSADYSGLHFTVKYFLRKGNKNMGYKTLAVVSKNAFTYFGIDIEQALKAGEIEF